MYKGIFWLVESQAGEELITVKVQCSENGEPLEPVVFSSKSGENFNHKMEWKQLPSKITCGKPFDYYPRGRVENQSGRITVYCHPNLSQPHYKKMIVAEFQIPESSRFVADGSNHYQARIL